KAPQSFNQMLHTVFHSMSVTHGVIGVIQQATESIHSVRHGSTSSGLSWNPLHVWNQRFCRRIDGRIFPQECRDDLTTKQNLEIPSDRDGLHRREPIPR